MADELFKGFMVGNAIATKMHLQQIQGQMAQEKAQREYLKQCRDYIHNKRSEVEKCIQSISSSPAYAYVRSHEILEDLRTNDITPSSFDELIDKEYCSNVIQNAEKVIKSIETVLSADQMNNLKKYYMISKQYNALKNYKNWKIIYTQTPFEPLDFYTKLWRSGGNKRLVLFGIFCIPFGNISLILAFVHRMVNRFVLLESRFPEMQRLASETGGFVTKDILKSQAKKILHSAEQRCLNLELKPSDLSSVDVHFSKFENQYMTLQNSCGQYQIPA